MSQYVYNADVWFYKGQEYRRGDLVTIPDDLDDDHKAFIEQLVSAGTLVKPGHADKADDSADEPDESKPAPRRRSSAK